jgi:hypothetical protein
LNGLFYAPESMGLTARLARANKTRIYLPIIKPFTLPRFEFVNSRALTAKRVTAL